MTFNVIKLPEQIIVGLETAVPTIDLAGMSQVKAEVIAKLKAEQAALTSAAVDDEFYGINFTTNEQNYLAGVKVAAATPTDASYTVAAGLYAQFTTTVIERSAIDQFIAGAYASLNESAEYQLVGGHNLEVITSLINGHGTFQLYIPVVAK
ncbi:GyrI-like domain-containing protein [Loigolactobacillus zhaoyuanensis]|uniref:GyrI-like domain-containing protein n=1 Tax=Loigolactobacillus zhaoyuanensis TaxID=2486017 RepID=A0ABW8UCF4_9LACO|nr:effector binding domain-containing protein [Loigolactobacillus zhaoyuanensis]